MAIYLQPRTTSANITLAYCGPAQRSVYLNQLRSDRGIPAEVLDFALGLGDQPLPAYGRNMNWMLLDTIGSMAACVDDDILCTPLCSPGNKRDITLSSCPSLGDLSVYKSREEAINSVTLRVLRSQSETPRIVED